MAAKKAGVRKPAPEPVVPAGPLDVAKLLAPIAGDDACGVPLAYAGTYDEIREARRADDPALPRGVWETSLKRADWTRVERLCVEALSERTKDLQIAVWLCEASFMRHGLPGLSDGLAVVDGLLVTYWDGLYPLIQDDDPEYRTAPLEWLSEHLPVRLQLMPLNANRRDGATPFCLSDWNRLASAGRPRDDEDDDAESDDGEGARRYRSREEVLAATLTDPAEHYRDLVRAADRTAETLKVLENTVDSRFSEMDAPGYGDLHRAIAGIRQFAARALERAGATHLLEEEAGGVGTEPATDEPAASDGSKDRAKPAKENKAVSKAKDTAAAGTPASTGPINSRTEAYRRLEEAAEWLMANEPHSPTPYLIRRAVSWRDKSLGELMSDETSRTFLMNLYEMLSANEGQFGGMDDEDS